MIFTVVWKQAALDKLATIWLESPTRQAIADAADRIDNLLKYQPLIGSMLRVEGI